MLERTLLGKTENVDRSDKSIQSMLNFLRLVTAVVTYKKILFLGNTHLNRHHGSFFFFQFNFFEFF